jgi:hypothetical protein
LTYKFIENKAIVVTERTRGTYKNGQTPDVEIFFITYIGKGWAYTSTNLIPKTLRFGTPTL